LCGFFSSSGAAASALLVGASSASPFSFFAFSFLPILPLAGGWSQDPNFYGKFTCAERTPKIEGAFLGRDQTRPVCLCPLSSAMTVGL
jgi:hypothetical protein